MYSELLLLVLLLLPCGMHAGEVSPYRAQSAKLRYAKTVSAVHSGSPMEYRPLLESLKKPTKKISFFNAESGQSSTITPMQLCIDAIFDRPQEDKLPLIHAMRTSLIQRCPKILTTACYEDILPFVYAYQKLPVVADSFDLWVPELFTVLASNVARENNYAHPAMICALVTQVLSRDEVLQQNALHILYKSPLAFSNVHYELRRRARGINLSNLMLTNGLSLTAIARICVQELATADVILAYRHCLQLLQSPCFQESPDAQTIKDNLLFWAVENPQLPREFIAQLLSHEADPYALKPQRGIMTPLQKSLEIALKTKDADQLYALTTVQTLLNVDERRSKMCTLSKNFALAKTYTVKSEESLADDVRFELREQIGTSFCASGLEPFLQHLVFWENIALCLRGDIEGARCAIYDILAHKTIQRQLEISKSVMKQPLFRSFVLALESEKFCRLAAHNMAESASAFDLYEFLSKGYIRQVYSDDEITKIRCSTDALYKTLSLEIQNRICTLVKHYLK